MQIKELGIEIGKQTRFIKVVARQLGAIPDWHPGAGAQSFIFIDEITVE